MRYCLVASFLLLTLTTWGQRQPSASEILLRLKKLNVLGSVLYVAAHPDDENTRAIAYFANDRLYTTAYLSLTRGDGGQNLIGPELRDALGVIRTQELLAARRLDGGIQFFTRANDFGFSKNPEETYAIWGKQQILEDMVFVIRQFQPDVIITRFPPDARAGHGHHTASALLAHEAFELAGNPTAFPGQLTTVSVWQPRSLYTNTGRWWNQTINENTPGVVSVNVGTYNPLLGKSYSELAAESRSQHKSQGFGSTGRRGDALEFFEHVKGEKVNRDFFENTDTQWSRISGGKKIGTLISQLVKRFNPEQPARSVPALLTLRAAIHQLPASVWRNRKLEEVEQLIQDCLGLFVEVVSEQARVVPGEPMTVAVEIVNRSSMPLTLTQIEAPQLAWDSTLARAVSSNSLFAFQRKGRLDSQTPYTTPFWLRVPHAEGTFHVPDESFIGKAENPMAVPVVFGFQLNGQPYRVKVPVIFKSNDPVKGEVIKPLAILPPVLVRLPQQVFLFRQAFGRDIKVTVTSVRSGESKGLVRPVVPPGWWSVPVEQPFHFTRAGEELTFTFQINPGRPEGEFTLALEAEVEGKKYTQSLQEMAYDHIPVQTILRPAKARAIRAGIQTVGNSVAYLRGAGDEIPAALRNLGYEVWEMTNEEVTLENLKRQQAVVLGVRALNTNTRMRTLMPVLWEYVAQGGTLIVQYNNNFDLEIEAEKVAPFSLTLSRERVTEEKSEVRFLQPDHIALNYPNKITSADFAGWVQERGLYFPSRWDNEFAALLSMNDAGEPPRDGGLLVARYGRGHYVYTGLSFFRELPEGVVGAYRLFANLVSLSPAGTSSMQPQAK